MIKTLEYLGAAVGLAEGGDREGALQLLKELDELKKSKKAKILVVSDHDSITNDVALHLTSLAKRLSSDVVFVSSSAKPGGEQACPEGLRHLSKMLEGKSDLACIPAAGCLEQMLKRIMNTIQRVEFAVLIGKESQHLRSSLRIPAFSL